MEIRYYILVNEPDNEEMTCCSMENLSYIMVFEINRRDNGEYTEGTENYEQ
jgi:hypothetical protein